MASAGARVRVKGLVDRTQWNEQEGTVLSELPNGRVCVKLDVGKELSLQWHSLERILERPQVAGTAEGLCTAVCAFPQCSSPQGAGGEGQKPFKRCARCHCAVYCSTECAKGDWGSHKKTCVPLHADYEAYPHEALLRVHPYDGTPAASDFFLWSKSERAKPKSPSASR
jgi:hypothetical protein